MIFFPFTFQFFKNIFSFSFHRFFFCCLFETIEIVSSLQIVYDLSQSAFSFFFVLSSKQSNLSHKNLRFQHALAAFRRCVGGLKWQIFCVASSPLAPSQSKASLSTCLQYNKCLFCLIWYCWVSKVPVGTSRKPHSTWARVIITALSFRPSTPRARLVRNRRELVIIFFSLISHLTRHPLPLNC